MCVCVQEGEDYICHLRKCERESEGEIATECVHVYGSYVSPYVHSASLDLATCGLWDGMESRYKYCM